MEARDRKRLLATLLEEIVLRVNREAGHAHVLLRWRGGRIDESELPLPALSGSGPGQRRFSGAGAVVGTAIRGREDR